MAPAMQPAEIQFAQRLASHEKGIRDRAVKKLRQYISVKTQRETAGNGSTSRRTMPACARRERENTRRTTHGAQPAGQSLLCGALGGRGAACQVLRGRGPTGLHQGPGCWLLHAATPMSCSPSRPPCRECRGLQKSKCRVSVTDGADGIVQTGLLPRRARQNRNTDWGITCLTMASH